MATSNNTDEIPDDIIDFPDDFENEMNMDNIDNEVVLTPPPARVTPPPQVSNIVIPPHCSFNEKTIERLLKNHFKDNIKVGQEALKLFSEFLRIYSTEIIMRAGEQAIKEESSQITLEQLEKVLPQFLLDFN